jgi:hypothetical protein
MPRSSAALSSLRRSGAIGWRLAQIVDESLCEAMDLRAGQKVLDVAAGNHIHRLCADAA